MQLPTCRVTVPVTVAIWIWFACSVFAADFTGKVVGVTDGDTITVLHNGRGEKIRLNGIGLP